MVSFTLNDREDYQNKIKKQLRAHDLVFVLGVRRCGKTCMAVRLERDLLDAGENVVRINFETVYGASTHADELIGRFEAFYDPERTNYLLLDEITHIEGWQRVVDRVTACPNCKLVLFSSNKRIVSTEIEKVAAGEYGIVRALPLSLSEYIEFQHFTPASEPGTPVAERQFTRGSRTYPIRDIYRYYVRYGGLPILKPEYMDLERARVVIDGSYSSVVTHDILEIGSTAGVSAVTEPLLLRTIITIMAKGIGGNLSATSVGKQTAEYLGKPSSTKTIESYIRSLLNAHMFYESDRYDIHEDKQLKTLAKYYIVDGGFFSLVTGIRSENEGKMLENNVFFEFLRRGYSVSNGKLGRDEITMIATRGSERIYALVAVELNDENADAVIAPLRRIRDSYPKMVVALDAKSSVTRDGIIIKNALEFLMNEKNDEV